MFVGHENFVFSARVCFYLWLLSFHFSFSRFCRTIFSELQEMTVVLRSGKTLSAYNRFNILLVFGTWLNQKMVILLLLVKIMQCVFGHLTLPGTPPFYHSSVRVIFLFISRILTFRKAPLEVVEGLNNLIVANMQKAAESKYGFLFCFVFSILLISTCRVYSEMSYFPLFFLTYFLGKNHQNNYQMENILILCSLLSLMMAPLLSNQATIQVLFFFCIRLSKIRLVYNVAIINFFQAIMHILLLNSLLLDIS